MNADGDRVLAHRYRLLTVLGHGGMGTVWRARDELLVREVAVKEVRLPAGMHAAERTILYRRTIREARTAARLNHPNVVTVFDVVEEDQRPWIVMALVPARPLDTVVAEDGPLPPQRAAWIGVQVLGALRNAHAAGVLHRDVKPANVLIGDGDRVVLTDFGIATVEGDPSITQSGTVLGSPAYLAPERARGQSATAACDLWALGATLFMAVEGCGPYDRDCSMATLGALLTEEPPVAIDAGPLAPVLDGLLTRDPERRMGAEQAAELFDESLTSIHPWTVKAPAPGEVSAAAVALTTAVRRRTTKRRPPTERLILVAVLTGILLLFGALAGGGWLLHRDQAGPRPAAAGPPVAAGGPSTATTGPAPARPESALPSGYRVRHNSLGFTVALPDGWRIHSTAGHAVTYSAPGRTSYLMVDQSSQPTGDPLTNVTRSRSRARSNGKLGDLRTVRMERTTYLGRPAADWEFTWQLADGTVVHCLDRQVMLAKHRFLTAYWQTAQRNWTADRTAMTTALHTLRLTGE